MDKERRAHCIASTPHARYESSGFLPVETSKTLVCAAPVDNEEAFHHGIVDASRSISNYPGP
jgi:hypothetical protein